MSRKIRRKLAYICVSIVLSIVLPLFSTLTSGHFSLRGWAVSVGLSIVVSILVALILPVGTICDEVCKGLSLQEHDIRRLCVCSLICDLAFVPIGVFLMVGNAYIKLGVAPQGVMSFPTMFISAVIPCMGVGFVIILLLLPLFTGLFLKESV